MNLAMACVMLRTLLYLDNLIGGKVIQVDFNSTDRLQKLLIARN